MQSSFGLYSNSQGERGELDKSNGVSGIRITARWQSAILIIECILTRPFRPVHPPYTCTLFVSDCE